MVESSTVSLLNNAFLIFVLLSLVPASSLEHKRWLETTQEEEGLQRFSRCSCLSWVWSGFIVAVFVGVDDDSTGFNDLFTSSLTIFGGVEPYIDGNDDEPLLGDDGGGGGPDALALAIFIANVPKLCCPGTESASLFVFMLKDIRVTAEHVSLEFKSSAIAPIATDNEDDDDVVCVNLDDVDGCVGVCADVAVVVDILCESDGSKNETERLLFF